MNQVATQPTTIPDTRMVQRYCQNKFCQKPLNLKYMQIGIDGEPYWTCPDHGGQGTLDELLPHPGAIEIEDKNVVEDRRVVEIEFTCPNPNCRHENFLSDVDVSVYSSKTTFLCEECHILLFAYL